MHTLSELGVILPNVRLGLEFSLRRLLQVGPTAGLVAVAQSALGRAGQRHRTCLRPPPARACLRQPPPQVFLETIHVRARFSRNSADDATDVVFGLFIQGELMEIQGELMEIEGKVEKNIGKARRGMANPTDSMSQDWDEHVSGEGSSDRGNSIEDRDRSSGSMGSDRSSGSDRDRTAAATGGQQGPRGYCT